MHTRAPICIYIYIYVIRVYVAGGDNGHIHSVMQYNAICWSIQRQMHWRHTLHSVSSKCYIFWYADGVCMRNIAVMGVHRSFDQIWKLQCWRTNGQRINSLIWHCLQTKKNSLRHWNEYKLSMHLHVILVIECISCVSVVYVQVCALNTEFIRANPQKMGEFWCVFKETWHCKHHEVDKTHVFHVYIFVFVCLLLHKSDTETCWVKSFRSNVKWKLTALMFDSLHNGQHQND